MAYVFKWVSKKEFINLTKSGIKKAFDQSTVYFPEPIYSTTEKKKIKKLTDKMSGGDFLGLVVFDKGKVVAFSQGEQTNSANFLMRISAVLKPHRNKGIYTKMLNLMLKETKKRGFQIIKSYHRPSNAEILVAKIKAGFIVSGIHLDDIIGSLVELSYFHNPKRREIFDYRTGQKHLSKKIRKKFPKGQI